MSAPTQLRSGVNQLVRYADRDLSALWRGVADVPQARTALMDVLPALIETYGSAASALAATWYDDLRETSGIARAFQAIPVEASERGAQALAGWATSTATDVPSLQSLILGGVQRRIADHSRLTVMTSSVQDPVARGWRRVGDGSSCDFCSMLLDRGSVYSEETADFKSHDSCGCGAEPDWS